MRKLGKFVHRALRSKSMRPSMRTMNKNNNGAGLIPTSLMFCPGKPIMEFGSADFPNARSAMSSPLAKALYGIDGVTSVFLGSYFVMVTKSEDASWDFLKEINAMIKDFCFLEQSLILGSNTNATIKDEESVSAASMDTTINEENSSENAASMDTTIKEEYSSENVASMDTTIKEEDSSETVAMIKELLETRIRPAMQDDGGNIEYVEFDPDTGVVKLRMQGSWEDATLKGAPHE